MPQVGTVSLVCSFIFPLLLDNHLKSLIPGRGGGLENGQIAGSVGHGVPGKSVGYMPQVGNGFLLCSFIFPLLLDNHLKSLIPGRGGWGVTKWANRGSETSPRDRVKLPPPPVREWKLFAPPFNMAKIQATV